MTIPAPLFFVAAMILGFWLGTIASLDIGFLPEAISSLAGNTLLALAIVLAMLSQRQLRQAKTGQLPGTPTISLVTTGPYAISRNPIYLAWAVFQLGLGIWLRNGWIVAMLAPAIFIVNVLAIIPEEQYLEKKFGQSYRDYRSRVRRWL